VDSSQSKVRTERLWFTSSWCFLAAPAKPTTKPSTWWAVLLSAFLLGLSQHSCKSNALPTASPYHL